MTDEPRIIEIGARESQPERRRSPVVPVVLVIAALVAGAVGGARWEHDRALRREAGTVALVVRPGDLGQATGNLPGDPMFAR
ncbi:hypothetical protein J2S43_005247 [Catenuloplanes nepalensis]|uniref:Uncharacterized protein n=1 Tax=Catenuloplanes nepalensis TaxID=587533 RepID=A0ABT9MZ74_9ACTN|nr:hypothetical protein [Catenuloplanes nepalensis]MDP9796735.1 hypothetical protein [Catenuloplanes nepalensis]